MNYEHSIERSIAEKIEPARTSGVDWLLSLRFWAETNVLFYEDFATDNPSPAKDKLTWTQASASRREIHPRLDGIF